jgi:hypothetical protein
VAMIGPGCQHGRVTCPTRPAAMHKGSNAGTRAELFQKWAPHDADTWADASRSALSAEAALVDGLDAGKTGARLRLDGLMSLAKRSPRLSAMPLSTEVGEAPRQFDGADVSEGQCELLVGARTKE